MLGDNLGGAATAALVRWRSGGFASAPSVLAAVRSLLEDAPWIEASCDVGLLLVWASAVGALDIVQAIAANPAHWNKAENTHALAMIASAGLGHLNILEYLIKERNINPAASHNSALEWAAKSGQLEIVNFLLADSRVDPKDASSMAFVWACKSGHLEIVERLLEDGRSDPTDQNHGALICAARFGYTDIVARLLQDERVNVNAQEGHVLISPSVNGHGQTLEVLLNAGADLSLTQYRPFHLALQAGNAKIIRVFLRNTTGWADNVWMCMHILLQAPRRKYSLAEFLSIFM
ncbi:ankyrin repeat-containing domain protein [Obelidium mucronatum]|nr:ankyrin repeat-containing domain protein [Obelidium mucronatum]